MHCCVQTLVVRWLPPPEDSQNGIITGYKIKYKRQNARGSELVTTDSSDRAYTLSGRSLIRLSCVTT